MTAAAPATHDTSLPMAHTSDSPTPTADSETIASAEPARAARPRLRDQVAENPLLSLFGAIMIVLLGTVLVAPILLIEDTNDRIDRIEDRMEAGFAEVDERFDELESKFDAKFDGLERKFDELDAKFDELELKLTALIAALNMTRQVEAALAGDVSGIAYPEPPGAAEIP